MDCVVTRHVHCVKIWASVIPKMVPVFAPLGSSVLYVIKFVPTVTMDTNVVQSVSVKMAPTVVNLMEGVIVPQVILEPAVLKVVLRVIMGSTAIGPALVTSHNSVTHQTNIAKVVNNVEELSASGLITGITLAVVVVLVLIIVIIYYKRRVGRLKSENRAVVHYIPSTEGTDADGNIIVSGITNPVYTTYNQNVSNIEREIQRQQRQSNYHYVTSCNKNEVACNGTINDLMVAKHVSLPVNEACASGTSYDDENDSDRYTTLKYIQAKLDENNITENAACAKLDAKHGNMYNNLKVNLDDLKAPKRKNIPDYDNVSIEFGHVISSSKSEQILPPRNTNYDYVKPHSSVNISDPFPTGENIPHPTETLQSVIQSELDNIAETNNDVVDITSSSCAGENILSENDVTNLLDEIMELS